MKRNQLSKGGPGGGAGSKSLAKTTQYFTGQPGMKVNPGGVSQFGGAVGNHSSDPPRTSGYRGDPVKMGSLPNRELGNECAVNTVCGPGGSRTVMKSGTNAQHGPVAGSPKPVGRGFDSRSTIDKV
jgi:hypothetical protein